MVAIVPVVPAALATQGVVIPGALGICWGLTRDACWARPTLLGASQRSRVCSMAMPAPFPGLRFDAVVIAWYSRHYSFHCRFLRFRPRQ